MAYYTHCQLSLHVKKALSQLLGEIGKWSEPAVNKCPCVPFSSDRPPEPLPFRRSLELARCLPLDIFLIDEDQQLREPQFDSIYNSTHPQAHSNDSTQRTIETISTSQPSSQKKARRHTDKQPRAEQDPVFQLAPTIPATTQQRKRRYHRASRTHTHTYISFPSLRKPCDRTGKQSNTQQERTSSRQAAADRL